MHPKGEIYLSSGTAVKQPPIVLAPYVRFTKSYQMTNKLLSASLTLSWNRWQLQVPIWHWIQWGEFQCFIHYTIAL